MFVLAAAAGVLFRWQFVGDAVFGLVPGDIRHGHSHLMLMGWATPALMALMGARWPAEGGRRADTAVAATGWTSLGLALASFVPFLLYGYDSVPIGDAELPVAAILSGLAIFAWYGFAAVYFLATRGVERTPALRLWDLAVASLVVSSLGAWAVAGLMIAGLDSPLWEAATVHFFVELFGLGWLVVGVLGLIRSQIDGRDSTVERAGRILVGTAVAFVFLVGLPRAHTPQLWPILGSAAAGLVAAGLAVLLHRPWKATDRRGRWALVFLGATVAMLAALAVPPVADWGMRAGLRILLLHVAFGGFVTLALVVGADRQWGRSAVGSVRLWLAALVILLVTMLPATGLWPAELALDSRMVFVFAGAAIATGLATLAAATAAVAGHRPPAH